MRPHIIFYCFALLFIYHESLCQAWQPVSKSTHADYQLGPSTINLHTITVSNFSVNAGDTTFVLNKIGDCATAEFPAYEVVRLADRGYRLGNGASYRYLYPESVNGFEWIYDSLKNISAKITRSGIETLIDGVTDSVKTIALSTGDSLKITKNFGLSLVPAMDETLRYFKLAGIRKLNKGPVIPDFYSIFNFDIGDVFQYQSRSEPAASWHEVTEKYTIKEKLFKDNCFKYVVEGVRHIRKMATDPYPITYIYGNVSESFTKTLEFCASAYPKLTGNITANMHVEHYDEDTDGLVYYLNNTSYYFVNGLGSIEEFGNWEVSLMGLVKHGDTTGIVYPDSIIINQKDRHELPLYVSLSNNIVPENTPPGTFVGKISVNSNRLKIAYSLTVTGIEFNRCDNDFFYIRNDSLFTAASFSLLNKRVYHINIEAKDGRGRTSLPSYSLDPHASPGSRCSIYIPNPTINGCAKPVISLNGGVSVWPDDPEVFHYLWYKDDKPLPDFDFRLYETRINSPGIYTVIAIYQDGCMATSEPAVVESCTFFQTPKIKEYRNLNKTSLTASNYSGTISWYKNGEFLIDSTYILYDPSPGSYVVEVVTNKCRASSAPYDLCPNLDIKIDSLKLTAPESSFSYYDWYLDGVALEKHTKEIIADKPGMYIVVVSCGTTSATASTNIFPCMMFIPEPVATISLSDSRLTATKGVGYRWFLNDKELPDTTRSILISEPGYYHVYVFFSEGCNKASEAFNVTITDIERQTPNAFSLSYDAVTEILKINTTKSQMLKVKIFDCTGRLCVNMPGSTNSNEANLSLQNYPKGLYIIHIYNEKGMVIKKILK
jgi:hypothetical protein